MQGIVVTFCVWLMLTALAFAVKPAGTKWWKVMLVTAAITIVVGFALGSRAGAHSFYDPRCCSGQDCAPAKPGDVVWTPAGWAIPAMHETVPFSDPRIKPTPPGEPQFHLCVWHGGLICIYVPGAEG